VTPFGCTNRPLTTLELTGYSSGGAMDSFHPHFVRFFSASIAMLQAVKRDATDWSGIVAPQSSAILNPRTGDTVKTA
jgi:hypothetical protein